MRAISVLFILFSVSAITKACDSPTALMTSKYNRPVLPLRCCGSSGYYFVDFMKVTYFKALAFCHRHGMNLVSIESADEQECLLNHIRALGMAKDDIWTSGNDWDEAKQFVWMGTGETFAAQNYSAWCTNQPDNAFLAGQIEHCMGLWAANGLRWNDFPCLYKQLFICETRRN